MKRIGLLMFFVAVSLSVLAQNLTVSNVVRTGLLATCNNSNPAITASWSSGSGTSVSNGTLFCSDPCGTTTLLVNISNLKWEQQNAEWIHSVFFPTNSGFTVSGISLPNGFITYNNGCTGTCPVGITAGPGFYFDASGGNSCCPGAIVNDGNPCNNWGAATLNCSNSFTISFYLTFCNSILTTPTETFTLTAQSDGGTGCYDVNNYTSHTVAFTINVNPCGPIVNPSASAPVRSCAGGSLNYTSTLTAVCNNGGTVTWWNAPTGGTQLGSGSPFVYDPSGATCPGGQTLYATCCAGGATNCVPRSAVTIPGTCTTPSITAVQTTIGTCATGAGISSVSTSNTVNPLTYSLSPGGTSNGTGVFPGLTLTQYTLTVSDAGSCTATSVVSLTQAPQTIFSVPVISPITCTGLSNGSVSISATGFAPITFSINPLATQSPIGTFTGLSAQTYTISATDGNNCTATTSVTVTQPTPVQLGLTAPPIACQGGSTSIIATSTGGTPAYQFSLNGGAFQTGNQFSVTAGTYTITTMDANSCSTTATISITQPASVQCTASASQILCFGGNSTITVFASGGTTPYQYQLNSGTLQVGNSFSVSAGAYTLTVVDANSCSSNTTISISEPSAISVSLNASSIVCSGGNSLLVASALGGTPGYQYQLNTGGFQSSGNFSVTAGTYTITAKDINQCSISSVFTINEPTPVLVTASATSIGCTGGQSTLTAGATGGTPGYQYQLNAGVFQNSNSFAVSAGTYTITAKDANNCSQSTIVTITEPPLLNVSLASGTILCQGGSTSITATGTGGTGAYQYQLNSGTFQASNTFTVTTGTYTISIKDANNCTASSTITISEPNLLTLSLSSGSILCFGGSTSISSTAGGGTPAYQYSLNGGAYQSSSSFTATPGSYTVTVKDANNCTASSVIAITQPSVIQITNLSNTIPTCVPGNDATLTVSASGGSPGYQYSLNNGPNQNSNVFTGLGPGTYSVTVTDINGCSSVSSIQIITPNAPVLNTPLLTMVACKGQNTGSIQVSASGGTGSLTYGLQPGNLSSTSGQFNNLNAGTYTVNVTDASGCSANTVVTITEPPLLSVSLASGTILCQGGSTSITATGTGGTGAYQYQLNSGTFQASNTFTVTTGTYTISIKDANNCTASSTITISEPNLLTLSLSSGSILCFGGSTSISSTAGGGTPAYQYSLNGGAYQSSSSFTATPGSYTVTVKDANNCTASSVIAITQPSVIQITNLSNTIPTCVPGNDATLTVSASGGSPGYQYSLNNGPNQNANVFTGLGPGTYSVTVTDINGCSSVSSIQIITPNAPVLNTPLLTMVACKGQNTGSIQVSASGGTGSLTYGLQPGNLSSTSGQFNNLNAGTYTVNVTDASGCSANTVVTITEPPLLSVSLASGTILCQGGSTSITATGTGGTGAYQYQLNSGTFQASNTFTVTTGTYTISIKDANNCTASSTITISEPNLLTLSLSSGSILCFGGSTSISSTAGGGTPAYQYSLNGGAYQSSSSFTATPGSYTVTVKDANNCTASSVIAITQPSVLQITNLSNTIPTCVPGNDATLTVSASGGSPGYQYSLNNGPNQNSNVFTGLGPGTYSVTVTDINGCSSVSSIQIITPNAPVLNTPLLTMVACKGQNTGSIQVSASGGTGSLTYGLQPGNLSSTNGQFNNLNAGTYTVNVTDASGCSANTVVTITEPPLLSVSLASGTILCQGGSTSITATGTGGTGAYQYQLNSGTFQASNTFTVTTGTYTISIKDANNCTASSTITISEPNLLTLSLSSGSILCFGGSTSISSTAGGGTPAYQYSLNGGAYQSSSSFTATPGSYTVTVKDANNCTASSVITITEPDLLQASIVSSIQPTCTQGGSATVQALGGTPAYSYSWNTVPIQTTATAVNLSAATYQVIVTDLNGCADTTTVQLQNPLLPQIDSISTQTASCVPGCDGGLVVYASGGNGVYNYSINSGAYQTSNSFTSLCLGTYTITAQDANGCTVQSIATVTNPPSPVITQILTMAASCVPGCDGTATLSVSGGNPGYTYSVDNGINFQASPVLTGLCTGTYTVWVKDAMGCTATSILQINTTNGPQIDSIQGTNNLCFGDCNGVLSAITNGGTSPLTYSIIPAGGIQSPLGTFSGLCAGLYTIQVADANGCTYSVVSSVTEPSQVAGTLVSTQNVTVFGQSTGVAVISATGGTPGYSFTLSPNLGTQTLTGTFSGLPAGSYQVFIADTNGCPDTVSFIITEPPQLFVNVINVQNNPCYGDHVGSISASAFGGVGPYTYTLSPNLGVQNPVGTFSGLPAGIYTLQAQDQNGASNDTLITITQPSAIVWNSINLTNESCVPGQDGSIVASAIGGTGILTYQLNPGGNQNQSGVFSNLLSTSYTLNCTDQNGCSIDTTVLVPHVPGVILSLNATNPFCFGSSNGMLVATASSGTPPYQSYSLVPAVGVQNPVGTFTGLNAQSYTVAVTDAKGCTDTVSALLVNPQLLLIDSVQIDPVSCSGLSDAQIQVFASGGTGNLTYILNPGGLTNQSGLFNGLASAVYTVQVVDGNGCSTSSSLFISQPTPLVAGVPVLNMVTCYSGSDGSISISANGGTAPYSYTLLPSGQVNATGNFLNVSAGTYSILIQDDNGCNETIQGIIITEPPAILFTQVSHQDIACYGDFSGSITVAANGGTGSIQYAIQPSIGLQNPLGFFTGLNAQTYTVVASDASACTASTLVTIAQNPDIQIQSVTYGEPTCHGDGDGFMLVQATGGIAPLVYQLNGQQSFIPGQFNDLQAGNYLISVLDALGCRQDTTLTLNEPDSVYFADLQIFGVNCPGASNGKVIVRGQGGRGDYTYYLKPGLHFNQSGYFEGLHEGKYVLLIKDSSGCTFDTTIYITPSDPITSSITKKDLGCFGKGNEGWAEVTINGGEPPFTYLWSTDPIQIGSRADSLRFGYYFVEIVDANGCTLKDTVYINPGPCCEEVFIPNAFSPNGDGNNDLFRVTTSAGIELIQFAVYNRWGNKVWSTNDFRAGWDGKFLSKDEDMNNFFYIFRYTCLTDGQTYTKKGDLLLMR